MPEEVDVLTKIWKLKVFVEIIFMSGAGHFKEQKKEIFKEPRYEPGNIVTRKYCELSCLMQLCGVGIYSQHCLLWELFVVLVRVLSVSYLSAF